MSELEQELDFKIRNNEMVIGYFSGKSCSACEVIMRKIKEMIKDFPKVEFVEIDGEVNLELAAKYSVFNLPLAIVFVDGKESLRVGRAFDRLEFRKYLERYYNLLEL